MKWHKMHIDWDNFSSYIGSKTKNVNFMNVKLIDIFYFTISQNKIVGDIKSIKNLHKYF